MNLVIKELLNKLNKKGYEAYVVGGYVRDYLLDIKSIDVDICTNAKPKDIFNLFKGDAEINNDYGSVLLNYKNIKFEITTFRKDISYNRNNKNIKIEYVDDLKQDIMRRDLTINTLCMNAKGEIIDLLNGKKDLKRKIIKSVGNPFIKLKEDPLRILRTIRFATVLNFNIEKETSKAIYKHRKQVKKLTYYRKMEELFKILASPNNKKGIELLLKYKLDKSLELKQLKNVIITKDILGILSQLNLEKIYPLTKNQKEQIKQIKMIRKTDVLDKYNLYKNGLYLSVLAGVSRGIDEKKIVKEYNKLKIKSRDELDIKANQICKILNKKADAWLKQKIELIEKNILCGKIKNEYKLIKKYLEEEPQLLKKESRLNND